MTRHLLKLFDNIADLRFKDSDRDGGGEDDGEAVAIGMYSREGEYVPFSEPCVCEGQVGKKTKNHISMCALFKSCNAIRFVFVPQVLSVFRQSVG